MKNILKEIINLINVFNPKIARIVGKLLSVLKEQKKDVLIPYLKFDKIETQFSSALHKSYFLVGKAAFTMLCSIFMRLLKHLLQ